MKVMKIEIEEYFKKIKIFNNSLIMKFIFFLNINVNYFMDVNFIVFICYMKLL